MQKKILTAAVAAAFVAPAAAWAQSTVVLYGLVDVGYQNVSKYQATATNKSGFSSGGARSSRLGARATEDLGGGLSAGAVIEFDIQGDTGATSATGVTQRQTFVSLYNTNWGELSLGRQTTHSYTNVLLADGIAGGNSFQSFYTMEDQITRASNYVKYSSPLIGGGFTFGVGAAPGESATPGTKNHGNYLDMHVRWAQGPFGIGLAHARTKTNTSPAADFNEKDTSLAAYYKFSGWRLYGVHSRSKQDGTGAGESFRLNGARAEVDIGKGILAFSVAKRKNKLVADADTSFWGIGYYHQMTTRTQFYATYGRIKNETGGTLTLDGAWTGSTVGAGFDPRGFQVGMGHSF